ncbi:septum formation initiator family protein [Rathayibacter sp. YIM 133350]|uniref:FtsB family cell division protein n=1 Tax=Rathayibacter sp. YIM 133350 TaxID=3131992 RepID=UPI00307E205D
MATSDDARRTRPPLAQTAGGWVRGMRFSGFTLIMLALAIFAVIVIAPSVQSWLAQRQQISALQSTVNEQKVTVQKLTDERERWNDATFITTQARERLGYVLPGEVSFLVINDLPGLAAAEEPAPVSDTVQSTSTNWMRSLFASTMAAGLAPAAPAAPAPAAPTPEPTP